jgi:hypothetical protein
MVFPTALVAARLNSSLNAPSSAVWVCHTGSWLWSKPSAWSPVVRDIAVAAVGIVLHAGNLLGKSGALEFLPSRIPSSTRGHASWPFRRPAARRRSAFSGPPKTSLKGCGKDRRSNFSRAPPKKHSLALGSRAIRSLCEG